jgi:hypothetical protein
MVWFVVLGASYAAARRWGLAEGAWGVLGGVLLLLFPTAYPYGGPSFVAPAWIIWVVLQRAVPLAASPRDRDGLAFAMGAALLLSQFLFPDTHNFSFERWSLAATALIPHGWALLAAGALTALFLRPGARAGAISRGPLLASACAAGALVWLQSSGVVFARAELATAAGLGTVALLARRAGLARLRRAAWVAAGLLATHTLIRLAPEHHLWLDVFLLAGALSGDLLRRSPYAGGGLAQSFLLLLGVIAVGWSTSAWSMSRLEWAFLYWFLDPATVERHAGLLLPVILARFAIPVLLMRLAIAGEGTESRSSERFTTLFLGVKALAVLLVGIGTGWVSVTSDVYLEAVQHAGVWLVLLAGLVLSPVGSRARSSEEPVDALDAARQQVPEPARRAMVG